MSIQQFLGFNGAVVVRGVTLYWPRVEKSRRGMERAFLWAADRGLVGVDVVVNGDVWRGHVPSALASSVAPVKPARRGRKVVAGAVEPAGVDLGLGL